jgi:hypothetical protein
MFFKLKPNQGGIETSSQQKKRAGEKDNPKPGAASICKWGKDVISKKKGRIFSG